MTAIVAGYLEAIATVRPDLAGVAVVLHTHGWDSDAVEIAGNIFKFPKREEAVARLRREVAMLALLRPRVPLAVPDMRLHEAALVFSEHRMIPGSTIETSGYEVLASAKRQAMADKLAAFYAALHNIPVADARGVGAEPKPEWETADTILPILANRLPTRFLDFAERAHDAYAALPLEAPVFGYFDGHGWNMAFDHDRGVLNGVYDFADAAIGPRSRDFTYSNLISPDLTERIILAYEVITGLAINRRTVAVRTSVQFLSELAGLDAGIYDFVLTVGRWIDHAEGRPELRL